MKKFIFIVGLLLTTVVFSSCSKDDIEDEKEIVVPPDPETPDPETQKPTQAIKFGANANLITVKISPPNTNARLVTTSFAVNATDYELIMEMAGLTDMRLNKSLTDKKNLLDLKNLGLNPSKWYNIEFASAKVKLKNNPALTTFDFGIKDSYVKVVYIDTKTKEFGIEFKLQQNQTSLYKVITGTIIISYK